MKRLIVNADDFGLSEGANLGILRAHKAGIVTSATVMMNMPGAVAALAVARETPSLGVGIHLTLTGGRPLCSGLGSLTNESGEFLRLPAIAESARPDEVERELRAQVEAFLASGLRPTHLDSHHHIHFQMPVVTEVVRRLAAELRVPVRPAAGVPRLVTSFYGKENISPAALVAIVEGIKDGETVEIMCHPAYIDPDILFGSRYGIERVYELATLTAREVLAAVQECGVELISFREL